MARKSEGNDVNDNSSETSSWTEEENERSPIKVKVCTLIVR